MFILSGTLIGDEVVATGTVILPGVITLAVSGPFFQVSVKVAGPVRVTGIVNQAVSPAEIVRVCGHVGRF
jgi:hypothetical protein